MKVNFLIIGAARSATTSLSSILANHPSISFSKPKEPQFFSKENWRDHIDEYHKLFKKKQNVIYGEGSTNYTKSPSFNPSIINDIYEYNPNMKLIYIARNPLDRIKSHYKFALERGYTSNSINKEIQTKSIYTDISKYYTQIMPYINRFGDENMKIILFEDFVSNPEKIVNDICDFLNIPSIKKNLKKTHFNQSKKGKIGSIKYDNPKDIISYFKKVTYYLKRRFQKKQYSNHSKKISKSTLSYLKSKINNDIKKFEKLIDRDLNDWKL